VAPVWFTAFRSLNRKREMEKELDTLRSRVADQHLIFAKQDPDAAFSKNADEGTF